jgi:hypothetical protein
VLPILSEVWAYLWEFYLNWLSNAEIDIFNLWCLNLDALLIGIKPVQTISLEIRSRPSTQHRYVICIIPYVSKFPHLLWNP